MAKSPSVTSNGILNIVVKIEGQQIKDFYLVRSFEVKKQLNKIPFAEVIIADGDVSTGKFDASSGTDFLPGKEIELQVGYDAKLETIFKGIIVGHRLRVRNSSSNLMLRCYDKAIAMTVGRKSAYFLKQKDSDVMGKIVKDNSLKAKTETTTYEHPEIIQYNCTDWDFVLQRAKVNGQVVIVEEGELSISSPKFSGSAKVSLTYGVDVIAFDGEIDAHTQFPEVSCSAWDMKTQKILEGKSTEPTLNKQGNLELKKMAPKIGLKKPILLHTSAPIDEKMLTEWAKGTLLYSRMEAIRGTIKFYGAADAEVGELIEINGFGDRFNGLAYISKVEHVVAAGTWTTSIDMGLPTWYGREREDAFSAPGGGLVPPIHGLQTGIVKKLEEDPDKQFRIQVDVPVIEPQGDGVWARLANFYASKQVGLFFLPEVGDEVILGFMNDDPRFPVILGMVYSSKLAAPYKIEKENKTKAIVTKSKMKIEFDDKDKIIVIDTPGKNSITISDKDKSIVIEDQNKNKVELSDKGITLKSAKDITIDATGKLNLTAKGKITIDSKQDVALAGLNIKGDAKVGMSMKGKAQAEFSAAGQTVVKGAVVMIN